MVKAILQIVAIGVVVGAVAELIRSVPDPDLWPSGTSAVVTGVIAGAIAALVVGRRDTAS